MMDRDVGPDRGGHAGLHDRDSSASSPGQRTEALNSGAARGVLQVIAATVRRVAYQVSCATECGLRLGHTARQLLKTKELIEAGTKLKLPTSWLVDPLASIRPFYLPSHLSIECPRWPSGL